MLYDMIYSTVELETNSFFEKYRSGFAGAFIDREAETRGADEWDREKLKREASQQVHDQYDQNQNY